MIDYVLVRGDKKQLRELQTTLQRLPSVTEVHPLFGEWDLIMKVEADPLLTSPHLLWSIAAIPGVIESKRLGVHRNERVVSDLSNTQTRSDAL